MLLWPSKKNIILSLILLLLLLFSIHYKILKYLPSNYKLSQVIEPFAETTKIFNVNYNRDDTLIAYGCEEGKILIFDNLKSK